MRSLVTSMVLGLVVLTAMPAWAQEKAQRLSELQIEGIPDGRYLGSFEGLEGYELHFSVVRGFLIDTHIRYGEGLGKTIVLRPMSLARPPVVGLIGNFEEGFLRLNSELKGRLGVGTYEGSIKDTDVKGRLIIQRI